MANEKTTFADAFAMADQVLYSGVACITDLMVKEGLINLDFADVRAVMREMGKAMMGTGEASGEKRALRSAEAAIANPLIDDVSMKGARGLLISITGGKDLTLYEVDEAATRIREEVDQDANIIVGATFDESLEGIIRVSVVATGIDYVATAGRPPGETRVAELTQQAARRHPAHRRRRAANRSRRPVSGAAAAAPVDRAGARPRRWPRLWRIAGGRDDPADHAEAVAVRRAGDGRACAAGHADRPSSRRSPSVPAARPRMPRIDELPVPAQNQIRAQRGEVEETGPEKQRMTLLQRLAQVGLGRRDDSEAQEQRTEAERPQLPPLPPAPARPDAGSGLGIRQAAARAGPAGPRYPRPAGLPVHKPVDDDQLEIPAFLRRQAN